MGAICRTLVVLIIFIFVIKVAVDILVFLQANNPLKGIMAADEVLKLDSSNIPALLLKSEAHTQNEDYQEGLFCF